MKNQPSLKRKLFFLLLLLPVLNQASLAKTTTAKPPTTRMQIYNQAVATATADIRTIAGQKKWQDYISKLNVYIPNDGVHLSLCSKPLITSRPAGAKQDLARLRYEIRCESNTPWEVAVTVKPDIYMPVLVAKTMFERGRKLAASDVEMKKRNIVTLRDGFITSADEAVGKTVKRRMRAAQVITPANLEQPLLVTRGQRVLMIAGEGGVEARMLGEAMKKGRKGDIIKVRNISSQKIVSAEVEGPAVVRMLTIE